MSAVARSAIRPYTSRIVATVLVLTAGCDQPSPDATGGVEIPASLVSTIRPDEALGQTPFGRITDIELGPDGHLYVLDGLNRTIRVFDTAGTEVRSFGKQGQGPGELERPAYMFWGPGGRLWVLDQGNGRLTAFSVDGNVEETVLPRGLPLLFPFAVGYSPDGTLRMVGATSPDLSNLTAGSVAARVDGGEATLLTEAALPFVEWPLLFEHRTESMVFAVPVPFGGEPQYAFDESGALWYAHTAKPEVQRLTEAGEISLTITVDASSAPVTAADRAEALASPELDEVTSVGTAAVQELEELIPESHPPLEGFFFDDLGNVWVIQGAEGSSAGTQAIDVFNADGVNVGQARLMVSAQPRPRVRNGVLAAVIRDELDVESVVTYCADLASLRH